MGVEPVRPPDRSRTIDRREGEKMTCESDKAVQLYRIQNEKKKRTDKPYMTTVAAEAPAQGAEMSYQTNSSGGPPSSIGIANGGT